MRVNLVVKEMNKKFAGFLPGYARVLCLATAIQITAINAI